MTQNEKHKNISKTEKALKDSQKQKLLLSIYINLTEFIYSSAP